MLTILGIILTAAIAGGMYLLSGQGTKDLKSDMAASGAQSEASLAVPDASTQAAPGAYVDYSDTVVATSPGTKLLFFHAPWCPQCRALDEDIRVKGAPDGVTIIKVDYDSNQALRKKYGVTLQTTIVRVDDNGELVKKYVAYDEPSLDSIVKNLL